MPAIKVYGRFWHLSGDDIPLFGKHYKLKSVEKTREQLSQQTYKTQIKMVSRALLKQQPSFLIASEPDFTAQSMT